MWVSLFVEEKERKQLMRELTESLGNHQEERTGETWTERSLVRD